MESIYCNLCSNKLNVLETINIYQELSLLLPSEQKPIKHVCHSCGVCAVGKDSENNEYVQIIGGSDIMWVSIDEWEGII